MDKLVAVLGVLVVVAPCWARTVTVDGSGGGSYRTIQEALDRSQQGDTIIVKPGTYRGPIIFNGLRVTVRSEEPNDPAVVQATVITADADPSVAFQYGESRECVLAGFTITGYGILCKGASPTITGNVIRNCAGMGIWGQQDAAPAILGNHILSNQREGIYSCDGPIQGNTIEGNSAGLGFCNGPIRDNMIARNASAGGLYSCGGEISGNVIVGNVAATYGGGLRSCMGPVHHNVITGNSAGRSGGGLYECKGAIYNNTLVGNRAAETGGAIANCPTEVYNNIIVFNEALPQRAGGISGPSVNTYNAVSMNGPYNYGDGAVQGVGDALLSPLFIFDGYWNTNGTADKADDSWINGDYHLRSKVGRWDAARRQWVTDRDTSSCIDAGKPSSSWQAELWPNGKRANLGAYGGTPEASLSPASVGNPADLDVDEYAGPSDLQQLTRKQSWLVQEDLRAEDLNRNGAIDFHDFALFALRWRAGPAQAQPPIPDPMTWAVKPYATSPYAIAMVATVATSTDGTGVEYYFEDYIYRQYNSGWLLFSPNEQPRWEDTHAPPNTTCWYHVKARNRGNLQETAWSEIANATTLPEDLQAPTPNPMTWKTEPHGVAGSSIQMEASVATDASGVEYQFECTSHATYSSGWQDSPVYQVTSVPKGHYTFQVRARDKSVHQNMTLPSKEVAVDFQPPAPDPMTWASEPKEIKLGGGSFDYGATMTATTAEDDTAGVEYFFACTSDSRFSSNWQSSPTYTVPVGPPNRGYKFRVRARDTTPSHNETGWSSELPAR